MFSITHACAQYIVGKEKDIRNHFRTTIAEEMWSVFQQGGKAIDEVLTAYDLIEKKEEALRIYRFHEPELHLYDGVSDMIARIRKTKKSESLRTAVLRDRGRSSGHWD